MRFTFILAILIGLTVTSCKTRDSFSSPSNTSYSRPEPRLLPGLRSSREQPEYALKRVEREKLRTRRRYQREVEGKGLVGLRAALGDTDRPQSFVAHPTLTVVGSGVEVAKTGQGAARSGGAFLFGTGNTLANAIHWLRFDAPKK